MPEWTPAQKNAIEARGGAILVSAAAGSGKTAVLVERVIQILLDEKEPVDVDRLLIVTFTNAAAAEMRERISRALSERLFEQPGNQHILRQQMLLPGAKICTIDAFCKDLVQENFHKLSIGQDFRILDESELKVMEQDAAATVLETFYEEEKPEFLSLVELLSSTRNDDTLSYYIIKLYTYIMAHPFPEKWLWQMEAVYTNAKKIDDTQWAALILNHSKNLIRFSIEQLSNCNTILDREGDDILCEKVKPVLDNDIDGLKKLLDLKNWDDMHDSLNVFSFVRFPSIRGYAEHPVKNYISSVRKDTKKNLDTLKSLLCATSKEHQEDMEKLAPTVTVLTELVIAYSKELSKQKSEANALSFSDIEHFALELLVKEKGSSFERTDLAVDLQNQYAYILLDEYQDTNRAQDMLFEALSNGKNLFMVGDVKQSIYRFRQAMPQIFMEKKNSYFPYDSVNYPAQIVLDKNFRSSASICAYINFVFSLLFSEEVGELTYKKEEYLNPGASYPEEKLPSVGFHILNAETVASADIDAYEAEYLAKMIKEKVQAGFPVHDKQGARPIQYGDFAILLRSASSHIPNYIKVFKKFNIPVSSNAGMEFFETPEISTVLSFLRVIDNPMQDIPLLSIMMSPIFGFTPDELAFMKIEDRTSAFYACVTHYYNENQDNHKLEHFFNLLEQLRTYSVTMPTSVFLRKLYDETSYVAIAKSIGEAEQREGNLNLLLEYAEYFEKSGRKGLSAFIRFLDKMEENKQNLPGANTQNKTDAVKIMSIHRSKGLEFPFCILAGTNRKYNNAEIRESLLLHPELGIGLKVHDEELLYQYNTVPYNAVRLAINNAEMSENLRVLYVAMTRAKEYLYLITTESKLSQKLQKLALAIASGKLSPYTVGKAGSDSELLLYCSLLHPGGQELRALTNVEIPVKKSDFLMDIQIIETLSADEEVVKEVVAVASDPDFIREIEKRLTYQYPYAALSNIAAKRNASSLDEQPLDFTYFAASRPAFLSEDGLTAAQKGSAMHAFMQHCDYKKAYDDIHLEAKRLVELGFLNNREYDALDTGKLQTFFASPFARRIFKAQKVMREIKFASFLNANVVYPELEAPEEKIYVQGIADCVFIEKGQMVVVDYKTDKIKDELELLRRYEKQLRYYCGALEETYQMPVKACYLYSFYLGKPLKYEFF